MTAVKSPFAGVCGRSTRPVSDLAAEACVHPRNLRRWVAGQRGPDGSIKLLCYIVALDELESLEVSDPAQLDALLGGSFTVKAVRDYLDRVFDEYDPLVERYEEAK